MQVQLIFDAFYRDRVSMMHHGVILCGKIYKTNGSRGCINLPRESKRQCMNILKEE